MIVIKATLREETRRLTFDSHGFPAYEDVQEKVSCMIARDGLGGNYGWRYTPAGLGRPGGNEVLTSIRPCPLSCLVNTSTR